MKLMNRKIFISQLLFSEDMDEVRDASKENEDSKDTEAAPLSRSESRGGDWKTQVSCQR